MPSERVLILGAAGRDFHCFNTYFRDNSHYEVIAFTATQIPGIAERRYPAELSGSRYAEGIPIYPEDQLETLIRQQHITQVVFAYSDPISRSCIWHRVCWRAEQIFGCLDQNIPSSLPHAQ